MTTTRSWMSTACSSETACKLPLPVSRSCQAGPALAVRQARGRWPNRPTARCRPCFRGPGPLRRAARTLFLRPGNWASAVWPELRPFFAKLPPHKRRGSPAVPAAHSLSSVSIQRPSPRPRRRRPAADHSRLNRTQCWLPKRRLRATNSVPGAAWCPDARSTDPLPLLAILALCRATRPARARCLCSACSNARSGPRQRVVVAAPDVAARERPDLLCAPARRRA